MSGIALNSVALGGVAKALETCFAEPKQAPVIDTILAENANG